MCGLTGELRFDGDAVDVATLQRMTTCLEHRALNPLIGKSLVVYAVKSLPGRVDD